MLNPKHFALVLMAAVVTSTLAAADDDQQPIKFRAQYQIEKGTQVGRIVIVCDIPPDHHIYSTQQTTPPGPTKFKVADSDQFKLTENFSADQSPTVIEHDPVFETRLEQFAGKVTFTAPLQLSDGTNLEKLAMELTVNCQVCSETGCVMVRNKKVAVSFGGYFDPKAEKEAKAAKSTKESSANKDD